MTSLSYIRYNYHVLDELRAETASFASRFLDTLHAIPLGEDKLIWKKI